MRGREETSAPAVLTRYILTRAMRRRDRRRRPTEQIRATGTRREQWRDRTERANGRQSA